MGDALLDRVTFREAMDAAALLRAKSHEMTQAGFKAFNGDPLLARGEALRRVADWIEAEAARDAR